MVKLSSGSILATTMKNELSKLIDDKKEILNELGDDALDAKYTLRKTIKILKELNSILVPISLGSEDFYEDLKLFIEQRVKWIPYIDYVKIKDIEKI